jgi:uncharacterized damage-inducible protein DinB
MINMRQYAAIIARATGKRTPNRSPATVTVVDQRYVAHAVNNEKYHRKMNH